MMRRAMRESSSLREDQVREENASRNMVADRLIESFSKKKGLGLDNGGFAKIFEASPKKARNLAFALNNQEKHLKSLTETQISDTFQTTPQTVVKVIRLGYPNSIRGDLFLEHTMQTMKDTMYKVESVYDKTARGANINEVTYESDASRFTSEIEELVVNGTGATAYTGTLTSVPLRPYFVKVWVDGRPVGNDTGLGEVIGAGLSTTLKSTINYTTGEYVFNFASALAIGSVMIIQYSFNSEVDSLYPQQGNLKLNLVAYDLRAHPFSLGFSWSKMAELLMESALGSEQEEVLISAGSDELKKSLDFMAITMAYRASRWTPAIEFDTDFAAAGSDSDWAHTQSVLKVIENAGNKTYDSLKRGQVSHMVAGPKAITYLKNHKLFEPDNSMPAVGGHLVGKLDGKPLYKIDSDIIPTNEILCIYRNNKEESADAALVLGTYIPIYRTQTLEYSSMHKETALSHFGDFRINEQKYLTRVILKGL